MNLESLAIESQETQGTQPTVEPALESALEITPLAFETFRLIGGGSSVVVL